MKPSLAELEVQATKVWAEGRTVCIKLADGREIRFPAAKNRRLHKATAAKLSHIELICDRIAIHWPNFDEDMSTKVFSRKLGREIEVREV